MFHVSTVLFYFPTCLSTLFRSRRHTTFTRKETKPCKTQAAGEQITFILHIYDRRIHFYWYLPCFNVFFSHRSTENWLLSAICHIAIFGKSVWQYLKNEVSWSLFSLFMPSTRLLTWIFHSPFSQKHWELISCDIPHLPYSANPYFKTKQWGNRLTFSLWNVSWTSLLTVYPCFMTVFTIFSVPITESFGKCLPCSKKFFHPFTQKTRKKRKGGVLGEP